MARNVPASHFVGTLAVNVDNEKLSDEEFRKFVRRSLPVVEYDPCLYELYEGRDAGNGPRLRETE